MFFKLLVQGKHLAKSLNKAKISHMVNNKSFSSLKPSKLRQDEESADTLKLKDIFQSEHQNLQSNYEPVSQAEKEEFLTQNRWVLFDKENSKRMELRKSTGEFDISVKFSNMPPEVGSKDELEPERFLDFYICIKRNNQPSGLFVEAVTVDSSVKINQIHFAENLDKYSEDFLSAKVVDGYTGPEFRNLDDKFQQEFLDLMIGLGITDELGSFLEVYSLDKDQRLVIDWLKDVNNII